MYIDNSNTSSPLIWGNFTNNLAAINGKLGVGRMDPTAVLDVKSLGGDIPIRAEVNSQTKFQVFPNGGASIGTNTQPATNGLVVEGEADINSNAAFGGDVNIDGNTVVNGSTQIGSTGTPFYEIIKISGNLSSTNNSTSVAFPSTYFNLSNTIVLSLSVDDTHLGVPAHQFLNTFDGSSGNLSVSVTNLNMIIEIEDNDYRGRGYELVLMKMD